MIVGCDAFRDPDALTWLEESENKERLEKCSVPPPISKNDNRKENWWIGRMTFGGTNRGNYRYEAALISPRHAIVSSDIVIRFPGYFVSVSRDNGVGCSSEAPELLELFDGSNKDPWLIFTKSNGIEQRSKWGKAFYYGRCTTNKPDGIIIIELSDDIDIPFVCLPDFNYYKPYMRTETVFSVKPLSRIALITKDTYKYESQDGLIERCEDRYDRFCWSPNDRTPSYKEFQKEIRVSMPFLTKDSRPLLFGFGFQPFNNKEHKFEVTDLGDFLEGLCMHVGVCPENHKRITPTTTTTTEIPTTAARTAGTARTARITTRRVPSTTDLLSATDNVPEFLYDEEARDFEEPFFKRNRTRKGGNRREWKIAVVFVILVLLVLE
ncbi:unnamed protein product [Caenorhabditis nigoni]